MIWLKVCSKSTGFYAIGFMDTISGQGKTHTLLEVRLASSLFMVLIEVVWFCSCFLKTINS